MGEKRRTYSQMESRLHRIGRSKPSVTVTVKADPQLAFTKERLEELVKALAPPPDPLNGANAVYVTPDNEHHALRLKEAYPKPLHIHVSELASPKVIACFRDQECVAIIRIGEAGE